MKHVSEQIENLKEQFVCQPIGITTGFGELDKAIWGFQPKQLITVGGRPAMGKTGLMVDMALAAGRVSPVGIFSMEMPFDQLQARMSANIADLNYRNIRAGECTEADQQRFLDAGQELKTRQIFIDDSPGMLGIEPYWLKARSMKLESTMDYKIKCMVQERGCRVIFVDYLQLIAFTNAGIKDRRIIVGSITEKLRDYAKSLGFCCVLMCQLRRFDQARYSGKNKIPIPTMDDLKESGEIENHSDVVVLLHRPEYYNRKKELLLTDNVVETDAELMVQKNRDGPTGNIPVEWHGFSMSYRDINRNSRKF
jgi:replicative DNA helicase